MAAGKLEPGAVCIVIGENRGFEENIGALVTLVEHRTSCQGRFQYWTFEAASRPILAVRGTFTERPILWINASEELPQEMRGCNCLPGFRAVHLLPIKGEDLGDEQEDEAPNSSRAIKEVQA